MIKKALKKIGYYLSIAYYDWIFRITLLLLTAKILLFCAVTHLGIISFLTTFGVILIALSFSLLSNNKSFKIVNTLLVNLIFSLILALQMLYFKFFHDFISIYNINQLHQVPAVYASILNLVNFEVFLFLDLLILPLIFLKKKVSSFSTSKERLLSFVMVLMIGAYCNLDYLVQSKFVNSFISRYFFAYNFGIIAYEANDIISYAFSKFQKQSLTLSELNFLQKQLTSGPPTTAFHRYSGRGKGKNLIFIQIESMQSFVIGRKCKGKEITPNLNKLLKHGVIFRNIYDQTSAGSSSDASFISNCSLYPANKGTIAFNYAQNSFDSLAKALDLNGYSTLVLHAYYKNFWNFQQLDKTLGFEHRQYQKDFAKDELIGWGLSDRSFFKQSVNKIKDLQSPFYVLMRTLTSHDPFDAVTNTIDNFPVDDLPESLGRYIRSMHYVDSTIGDFLVGLSEAGLLSQTIIVIYGDHRARLSEKEMLKIGVQNKDESRKIPIIIYNPEWEIHDSNPIIGGLIDLAPTVSTIMGISTSDKFFLGNDLGRNALGYVIFRDGTFISPSGNINREFARNMLKVSDLIIEKDSIPQAKRFASRLLK